MPRGSVREGEIGADKSLIRVVSTVKTLAQVLLRRVTVPGMAGTQLVTVAVLRLPADAVDNNGSNVRVLIRGHGVAHEADSAAAVLRAVGVRRVATATVGVRRVATAAVCVRRVATAAVGVRRIATAAVGVRTAATATIVVRRVVRRGGLAAAAAFAAPEIVHAAVASATAAAQSPSPPPARYPWNLAGLQ